MRNDIIGGKPTGFIRLSLGAMSDLQYITTFVELIEEFIVDGQDRPTREAIESAPISYFHIEKLNTYPVKSCWGWSIPPNVPWEVRPEGLAWDRE